MLSLSACAPGLQTRFHDFLSSKRVKTKCHRCQQAPRKPNTKPVLDFLVELRLEYLRTFGRAVDFNCTCHLSAARMQLFVPAISKTHNQIGTKGFDCWSSAAWKMTPVWRLNSYSWASHSPPASENTFVGSFFH